MSCFFFFCEAGLLRRKSIWEQDNILSNMDPVIIYYQEIDYEYSFVKNILNCEPHREPATGLFGL